MHLLALVMSQCRDIRNERFFEKYSKYKEKTGYTSVARKHTVRLDGSCSAVPNKRAVKIMTWCMRMRVESPRDIKLRGCEKIFKIRTVIYICVLEDICNDGNFDIRNA